MVDLRLLQLSRALDKSAFTELREVASKILKKKKTSHKNFVNKKEHWESHPRWCITRDLGKISIPFARLCIWVNLLWGRNKTNVSHSSFASLAQLVIYRVDLLNNPIRSRYRGDKYTKWPKTAKRKKQAHDGISSRYARSWIFSFSRSFVNPPHVIKSWHMLWRFKLSRINRNAGNE